MAGSSGQGTVATFLGGGAKGHRVDLVMIMSVTWMVIKVNMMGMIIRLMILVIIRMAKVTPTFRVDRNGEAPKLRRSSTISTRPAAAAS